MSNASLEQTGPPAPGVVRRRQRPQEMSSSVPGSRALAGESDSSSLDLAQILIRRDMSPIRPGELFRRKDLSASVSSLDYKLRKLVERDELRKVDRGIYFLGEKTRFGMTFPKDRDVLRLFLGSNDFFMCSLNNYNDIDIGTTQLYWVCLVYNEKIEGVRRVGGLWYEFMRGRPYPSKLTLEFMYVDAMNNLMMLAEDLEAVTSNIIRRAGERCRRDDMLSAVRTYGTPEAKAIFAERGYA